MLKLDVQNSRQVTVLRCSGRIVKWDGADDLLRAVMSQNSPRIQIDLSGVRVIDAGGLGVLARLERWGRDTDRTVELVNPSKPVWDALAATELNSVLQICRGRGEAA